MSRSSDVAKSGDLQDLEMRPDVQVVSAKEKTKCWIKRSLSATRRGAKWVADDCRKGHLMWVKVIFLFQVKLSSLARNSPMKIMRCFQSASLVTLYPYLTVHMRSLGFDLEDAAVVNTAVPIADIVAPPLAGMIADKLGNFRYVCHCNYHSLHTFT